MIRAPGVQVVEYPSPNGEVHASRDRQSFSLFENMGSVDYWAGPYPQQQVHTPNQERTARGSVINSLDEFRESFLWPEKSYLHLHLDNSLFSDYVLHQFFHKYIGLTTPWVCQLLPLKVWTPSDSCVVEGDILSELAEQIRNLLHIVGACIDMHMYRHQYVMWNEFHQTEWAVLQWNFLRSPSAYRLKKVEWIKLHYYLAYYTTMMLSVMTREMVRGVPVVEADLQRDVLYTKFQDELQRYLILVVNYIQRSDT